MSVTEVFLIAMSIILSLPYFIWRVFRTDYYAPLVVVQIITGILLGPGILGKILPEYYEFIFRGDVIAALNGVAWWAVMIFVFVAGIELDLSQAWRDRLETGLTSALALATPFAFGCVAAVALCMKPGWLGQDTQPWQFILGIGMSCAVTALPILILLMEKLEILRTPVGQRILRYASLDDIAIWAVLAIILLDWERVGRQLAFLLLFSLASYAIRALMVRLQESDRWYVSLIWLALCGFSADWAGLHFMVGSFLAGAALNADWFDQRRLDLFRHHILLTIMPVFFLSTGLRTSWNLGGLEVFAAAGALLAAAVTGKLVGVGIAGRILGWAKGEALFIGWLLQTKALIMIIFANILLDKKIISSETFTALLIMAVVSTMLTIPAVHSTLQMRGRKAMAAAD